MEDAAIDIEDLVRTVREEAGPQMVPTRQEAEDEARAFLDRTAGRMTRDDARAFAKILNRGFWGTGMRHNRFLPGFSVPLVDKMTEDLERFNELTHQLWRADLEEALEVAGEIFVDSARLPGSGRSYPSVLLYLREPTRFSVWFDSVDRGLAALTGYVSLDRAGGAEAYLEFSQTAQELASGYSLEPQEVDAVLAAAARDEARQRAAARQRSETPTIGREAFEFLQDLSENNNKEWFNANRWRYQEHLRDPLYAVFQELADRYITGLDPELITEVKRDAVLARMNKFSHGDPYYTYLWGAFSRTKKQQDVQLYVNLNSEYLHYGLYIGSAADSAREELVAEFEKLDDEYVQAFAARLGPDAQWNPEDSRDAVEVVSSGDAIRWAGGKDPHLRVFVNRDDPLIGSPDLVDTVGTFFTRVYPLAALAWGEETDVEDTAVEETARPDYTLDDLVRDTLLPVETLEEWIELLRGPERAALFYGPPGTGKTHVVEKLARYLVGANGETKTVQFHPSFSYEDFMEGLRPNMDGGQLGYKIRPGVFHDFCEQARGKNADYVFVIDEINRAELGSVLGEVMMLIEYRDRAVPLPYSQRPFSIPRNVVLLATMNTADRSLALVDFALRRRFHALKMLPDRDVLAAYVGADGSLALQMFDVVQKHVADEDYAPGHTYWMLDDVTAHGLERLWRYELRPYLSEYWFESRSHLDELEKEALTLLSEGA